MFLNWNALPQKIAKTFKGSIPDNILEHVIESFQKNHISLVSLLLHSETMVAAHSIFGFRSLQKGNVRRNQRRSNGKDEQNAAKSCSMRETAQITGMPKSSSFFPREKSETVLDLSEDVHLLLLPKEGSEPAVEATVVSSENVQRFIEHSRWYNGFSSL